MYVGITKNFDRRMYVHQYDAYIRNSKLPVHRAMRRHSHTTRVNFRRTCDRQGWNFDDFEEVFSRRVSRKDGIRKDTFYIYKKKKESEEW